MFEELDLNMKGIKKENSQKTESNSLAKEEGKEEEETDPSLEVEEFIKSHPWESTMKDSHSQAYKLIAGAIGLYAKFRGLTEVYKLLGFEKAIDLVGVPLIEGDDNILVAMLLQNTMHPDNSQRKTAIANKTYVGIKTHDEAMLFLEETLRSNLSIEIASRESAIKGGLNKAIQGVTAETIVKAPNFYISAAAMKQSSFSVGRGDLTEVANQLAQGPCHDAANKLRVLVKGKIGD